MPDEHCRITVVGEQRQVDLAVPVRAPITTYVGSLARMCAQADSDIMPAAWSLATVAHRPFDPERSLAEMGVVDGQILYLRNVIAEEFADPVVYEVAERVAEVAEATLERKWDASARTMTLMAVGLTWLVGTLIALAARRQAATASLDDLSFVVGFVLPVLAWLAVERRWPLPVRLREALALTSVPVLALAALLPAGHWIARTGRAHPSVTTAGLTVAVLLLGALVGALLAYWAAPGATSCTVLVTVTVAALLGVVLAAARADALEAAACTAALAFWLVTIAPAAVSRIVAFEYRRAAERATDDAPRTDTVPEAVHVATTLLIVWSAILVAVAAAALVPMAASRSPYATAAAGCIGLALLLRAATVRLLAEAVPLVFAGALGLFTLILVGPGHLPWPGWPTTAVTGAVAVAVPLYAIRRLMRRPRRTAIERPAVWTAGLASVFGGIALALAVETFGLYSRVVELGHHL